MVINNGTDKGSAGAGTTFMERTAGIWSYCQVGELPGKNVGRLILHKNFWDS